MTSSTTCPQCGNAVKPGTSFCALCGASLQQAAAGSSVQQEGSSTPSNPVCQSCGKQASSPTQKFCAACGNPIERATAPSATPVDNAAPAPAATSAAPIAPVVAAAATASASPAQDAQDASRPAVDSAALKEGFNKLQSNLNDFMGASIDTSTVGKDFNASTITLEGVDANQMAAAFSFFGKSYSEADQPAFVPLSSAVERRKEAEARDADARAKASRDFSATEGYMVYGALASKLQSSVGPTARMVESQHKRAWDRQKKNRLKHQVALGEMSQEEAVELAKD